MTSSRSYMEWKDREEDMRDRSRGYWRPEVAYTLPDGSHVELDRDNHAYFVNSKGVRRKIVEITSAIS